MGCKIELARNFAYKGWYVSLAPNNFFDRGSYGVCIVKINIGVYAILLEDQKRKSYQDPVTAWGLKEKYPNLESHDFVINLHVKWYEPATFDAAAYEAKRYIDRHYSE